MDGIEDDRRTRMLQLAELLKPTAADLQWREENLERLREIAEEWARTGSAPECFRALSSGEKVAVCIASKNSRELDDAFYSFLMLDGWLQKWVLHQRGLGHFVGTAVGTETF